MGNVENFSTLALFNLTSPLGVRSLFLGPEGHLCGEYKRLVSYGVGVTIF